MAAVNLANAINKALADAMADDPTVVVMGEDVGRTGGVFRVTDGLFEKFGAERVIDTPVAESAIAGVGLGMAVGGLKPILEMQFMGFSYPAFDQVISHISRIRNRSRHRFTAPLVIRIPYGGGIGAAEHHSESAEAIYVHTPGLKVVAVSRPSDAYGLLREAIDDPDPVIFLEPIRLYRAVKEELTDARVPIGSARIDREGSDVTIVAYGAMMRETRAAATQLASAGVEAEVIDLRSLVPLDVPAIVGSIKKTGRAVVVHEAPMTAGVGAEVVAQIQERALYSLESPVRRVTGWDTVFPLKRGEDLYLPSVERIVAAVESTLDS